MTSQRVLKQRNASSSPRRTRGKVQPPSVPQSADYWEEFFQRCLHEHERKRVESAPLEAHADPARVPNRSAV
jgi:hypothetical protein